MQSDRYIHMSVIVNLKMYTNTMLSCCAPLVYAVFVNHTLKEFEEGTI